MILFLCILYSLQTISWARSPDFFPFAIRASPSQEILRNSLTRYDQEALTLDFINSGVGTYSNANLEFDEEIYPVEDYAIFHGLDDTSMFATSVSIDGGYAAVGANGYDAFNGAVYVFTISGVTWTLSSTIRSPDSFNSNFGLCVDVDGSNLMISANGQNAFTGRVYVYSLNSYNVWVLSATIQSPLGTFDSFGYTLDLSGTTAVIGSASGRAFIYEQVNNQWVITKSLTSLSNDDNFGRSVAVWGNTVVVGAYGYKGTDGLVYVYTRSTLTGTWSLTQTLTSVTGPNSQFGYSLAVYNQTIAIGAPGRFDSTSLANNTGSVYSYQFDPARNQWTLNQSIASPAGDNSYFGVTVKLSNFRLAIGADGYPRGNSTGLSYIYSRTAEKNLWHRNIYFPSPAGQNSHFGSSMAVTDTYAAIGAYAFNDLRGSVYLATLPYVFAPTASPTQAPVVVNSNPNSNVLGNLSAGVVAAIFLSGFLALGIIALIIYFCCCRAAPIIAEKKKKKEEEDSPYTVHSYMGYTEMNDTNAPRPPMPMPMQVPYGMPPPVPPPMDKKDMDKGGKIIDKADPAAIRKMFPYKVYSYRGYKEGDENPLPTVKEDEDYHGKEYAEGDNGMYDSNSSGNNSHGMYGDNTNAMMYGQNNAMTYGGNNQMYGVNNGMYGGQMYSNTQYQYQYRQDSADYAVETYDEAQAPDSVQRIPSEVSYIEQVPSTVEQVDLSDIRPDLRKYYEGQASAYVKGKYLVNTNSLSIDEHANDSSQPAVELTKKVEEQQVNTETAPSVSLENAQAKYARYLAAAKNPAITARIQAANISNNPASPQQPPRPKPKKNLQSASVELDVALTEPMKLLSIQESRERTLRSDSVDPEARGNDLAQQDEVNRLRYVEAARRQAIEEAQSRMIGSVPSTDEDFQLLQEENRLREEAKLRNEEKIRARFAMFKSKAEESFKDDSK